MKCDSRVFVTSCFCSRRWPEATSVFARQDLWDGTVRFREIVVPAVHVGTVAVATPCWTGSCVNARRASLVQPVRWGLDPANKIHCKKTSSMLLCCWEHTCTIFLQVQNDPCSPNPCHNKAQCHSLMGDFYCSCPDDYEGKTCSELKDHCKTNLCQGNAAPGESLYLWFQDIF